MTHYFQVYRKSSAIRLLKHRSGLILAALLVLIAAVGPYLYSASPTETDLRNRLSPPFSTDAPLGTDELGRDVLAQVLYGFQWSLSVALLATGIALILGVTIGLLAGYLRGAMGTVFRQTIDFGIAFPSLVIAITILATVGSGFFPLAITLGLVVWPIFSRVVYAETLSVTARGYIRAAHASGLSKLVILFRYVIPNIRSTIIVMSAFVFADMLLAEASLSFIGIGAPLTATTWGNMLANAQAYTMSSPILMVAPATSLVVVIVVANLLGNQLSRGRKFSPMDF